jgi:serine/threonine-protein kinase
MNEMIYIDDKFPSYQIIEMLSNNPTSRIFLAERGDRLFVIKEQPKEFCFLESPEILRELDCRGLPKIVDFYESDEGFFYSYEYISGVTLTEAYESGLIATGTAVAITEKLCTIVSYLHKKSLLHCDIKPDNILINGDDVFLIDFGIAHIYNKNGGGDVTALIGSDGYATPELGYKKTDFRADVYAIGMVLFYLLTGSSDIKELSAVVRDKQLRAIIDRAANYDVERRYKTVNKLKTALSKYAKGTAYRPLFASLTAAGFAACFIAGGIIIPAVFDRLNADSGPEIPEVPNAVYDTKIPQADVNVSALEPTVGADSIRPQISGSITADSGTLVPQAYVFSDPIIEQAIRISLEKTADEPVYPNELLSVEQIYITGDRAFASYEEQDIYLHSFFNEGKAPPYGEILSFDDFAACENLKILNIRYNMLESIDFLAANSSLQELRLSNTKVADIAVIRDLPGLLRLFIDDCPIIDLSPINDCPTIEAISLFHMNTANYDFFSPDRQYNDLAFGYVNFDKFMPYLSGLTIKRLSVRDCGITSFDDFTDVTVTEMLDVRDNNITDKAGSERILADGAELFT